MDTNRIRDLLENVAQGRTTPAEAFKRLRSMPYEDVGCAKHDMHRVLRNGFCEVIYCDHKVPDDVIRIAKAMRDRGCNVFGTRADDAVGRRLVEECEGVIYDALSRTFRIMVSSVDPIKGRLAIACGGTADIPVAEEARQTAAFFGLEARRFYDVGVAGLPRVLKHIEDLKSADAVIAVAGMEGALPSVLGGLIEAPIIAVPTSVGYGAHLGGLTTLLAMLNSCSEGIVVTNIDNGFGAACAAVRIIRQRLSDTSRQ